MSTIVKQRKLSRRAVELDAFLLLAKPGIQQNSTRMLLQAGSKQHEHGTSYCALVLPVFLLIGLLFASGAAPAVDWPVWPLAALSWHVLPLFRLEARRATRQAHDALRAPCCRKRWT